MKQLKDREFGLVIGSVCLLIAIYYTLVKHQHLPVLYAFSALLILAGFCNPLILRPLNKAWYFLGDVLGTINSYFLLSLVYFLVLTPIALLMRIFGKQPLRLKHAPKECSYWQKFPAADAETMKRQF